jgi:hypothetical protein
MTTDWTGDVDRRHHVVRPRSPESAVADQRDDRTVLAMSSDDLDIALTSVFDADERPPRSVFGQTLPSRPASWHSI